MRRREFLAGSGALVTLSLVEPGCAPALSPPAAGGLPAALPRYRGFNLEELKEVSTPRGRVQEQDFEIMAEWGMNFVRVPMNYWSWASPRDWHTIREEGLAETDEAVEFGKQYGIHVNLNLHRIPGYCINERDKEPMDLFEDTPERMQAALDAAAHHWRVLARRYRGIPAARLSFDLVNEPPRLKDEARYVQVVRSLVNVIREEDPGRLIFVDGKDVGRAPLMGIVDLGVVQSTRGYDPMSVTHYQAGWVPKSDVETLGQPAWPLRGDDGTLWNKETLRERLIDRWKPLLATGTQVHVGEWGCWNRTPHDVTLRWMSDILTLWREQGWGHAMWNLRGSFGVLDSYRTDVRYEEYKGHKLDRKMLELLRES